MAKKYLTFEEICALPLLQQAIRQEEERHRARMAEIQTMEKALNALELERAEIQRNGFRLFGESIRRDFAKSVLVYTGCMGVGDEVRLATALLRSGWKIVDRDGGLYPSPTFRKGRVNLKMSCWHQDVLEKAEQQVSITKPECAGSSPLASAHPTANTTSTPRTRQGEATKAEATPSQRATQPYACDAREQTRQAQRLPDPPEAQPGGCCTQQPAPSARAPAPGTATLV